MVYLGLILTFILGYIVIIFEKFVGLNKAGVALIMGVILWMIYLSGSPPEALSSESITAEIASLAQIIFFLLAAMSIVELIDSHQGFKVFTDILYTSSKKKMMWFLLLISFFMFLIG